MNKKEIDKPRIYTTDSELPSYLHRHENGLLVYDSSEGPKLCNWMINFGHSQDTLRGLVPVEERITDNRRPGLKFLGFDNMEIRYSMDAIQAIANDDSKKPKNPGDQKEYRAHLGVVYRYLARSVQEWVGNEKALVFPPLNGGRYVREVFEQNGFPPGDFYSYQMSRTYDETTHDLMLRATFGKENPDIQDHLVFVIADDCLASNISAWGTMEMIKSRIPETLRGQVRVLISVSAASQRGMENILRPEVQEYFGFGKIEAIAAIPVYQMNDHFYLLDPEDQLIVGDMGKWTNLVVPEEIPQGKLVTV